MKGILYGIGTGPGESTLITQKAIDTIMVCEVIALPSTSKENCTAYKIVKDIYPEIDSKEFLFLDFPMTKDESLLQNAHKTAADKICRQLKESKNVAFLTIGDVTVYSTFTYVKNLVEKQFDVVLVNGIPSFCAVAAKLGISISDQDEQIHIIPSSYKLKDSFNMDGTLVFMKSGKKLLQLKEFLLQKKSSYAFDFYAVSNCGMTDEKIYRDINELPDNASYFSIVIIKNKKRINQERNYKFFQNTKCGNFPCHEIENEGNFNCLFCYCPLYYLGDKCGGNFKYTEKGIKSCIDCNIPHKKENYDLIRNRLRQECNPQK